ncbi:MAG: bifunctional 3,4-dihydroxy-2-butanone-4-phosphate synthase/GTP cyclohydrolase II [Spirochaetes bacterium]|nr:bifunctional 3,4-dihydroxy-2-butanone-4-phosphate synthase/GTP cyclohydrolase II [Spirochaetota bacterium]
MEEALKLDTIPEAIADIRAGKLVVVVDDADRENEGDTVMAAELATVETVNFMIRHCRGLICVPLADERLRELQLRQMVWENQDLHRTQFTVSVDSVRTTTGISAGDRFATIADLAHPASVAGQFRRPGHIFPLRAEPGGVLRRAGHTEAAVDLARLAGLREAGVICEILKEDGSMARLPDLIPFAREHGLKVVSIADLIRYRLAHDRLVERVSDAVIPTRHGDFKVIAYRNVVDRHEHLAIVKGEVSGQAQVLVRVHSECFTGDVLGSWRCDCGAQLDRALELIAKEGRGVVLYLRQEGRGIGLAEKLKAYRLQDEGLDTVEANVSLGHKPDLRDYGLGAGILKELGLSSIRILTNNPRKIVGLEGYGLAISERVPLIIEERPENERYIAAKREKMGHLL